MNNEEHWFVIVAQQGTNYSLLWILILIMTISFAIFAFWEYKKDLITSNLPENKSDAKINFISDLLLKDPQASAVLEINPLGVITYASRAAKELLQYQIKNIIGINFCDLIDEEGRVNRLNNIINSKRTEKKLITQSGKVLNTTLTTIPYYGENLEAESYFVVIFDTTYQQKYRLKLQKELKKVRTISKISEMITTLQDQPEIIKIIINDAAELIEFDFGGLLMKKDDYLYYYYATQELDLDLKNVRIPIGDGVAGFVAKSKKGIIITRDNFVMRPIVSLNPHENESILAVPILIKQKLLGVMYFSRSDGSDYEQEDLNIVELLAAQVAGILDNAQMMNRLKDSRKNYSTLINETVMGVIIVQEKNLAFVNRIILKKLGYSEEDVVGRNVAELIDKRDRHKFFSTATEIFFDAEKEVLPVRFVTADERIVTFELTFGLINWENKPSIMATLIDITDKLMLNEQLFQNQRLMSLGELAGGITHDFKNVIAVIMGTSDTLMRKLNSNDELYKSISMIKKASERGVSLAERILGYSRKNNLTNIVFDINNEITDLVEMLTPTFPTNIEIKADLCDDILPFEGDQVKIQQCLLNICANAKDAMPKGGTISISSVLIIDDTALYSGYSSDKFIKIEIKDTGIGMPKDVQNRIFETFYTTKGRSKGTGLGLSTTKKIIDNYKGKITVTSEKGKGTQFTIIIPATEKPIYADVETVIVEPIDEVDTVLNVLFVDDDETILEIFSEMIEEFGCNVETASTVDAAHDVLLSGKNFDLVIADRNMPKMGGIELFSYMKKKNYEIPVVITSGMKADDEIKDLQEQGLFGFLAKPFSIIKLKKIIDEIRAQK
jgi:PAS domain S-box-containing protein